MDDLTTLFRPVGLKEMELILEAESAAFPPRLPHQPIFYPVLNKEYAIQIARDWNTKDETSGYSGFVTEFKVNSQYLYDHDIKQAGNSTHLEYWIPAEELTLFNENIQPSITIVEAFYGIDYSGALGKIGGMKNLNASEQIKFIVELEEYSTFDLMYELRLNREAILLNYLFWKERDFSSLGVDEAQKEDILSRIP